MKSVGTMILSVLVGIVFAVNGAGAQEMKEKTVKGQIFGVWAVVSVANDVDGKKTEPYGANPRDNSFSPLMVFSQPTLFALTVQSSFPTTAPRGHQRKTKRRYREATAASAPTKSVRMDQ